MENLIGNLNLKCQDEGQALYHSQLYGTFFGVYALITSEKTSKDSLRKIKSMTLRVVNYKGEINLGIEEATYIHGSDINNHTLRIVMRGCSTKTEGIDVPEIKGKVFENGLSRLRVERYLKPLHSEVSTNHSQIGKEVFDSEFHYREGIIDGQDTLREDSRAVGGRPAENKSEIVKTRSASGWFCPYAELVMLWL